MPTISLGYTPRPDFVALHRRRKRWFCAVCHRRAGKTVACIADLIDDALRSEKPNPRYAYVAPLYRQAKDVAWQYVKDFTAPLLPYGAALNESELRVDLPNGGRVRLYGADNPDSLRGIYLDGVVLDEYGDMDPRAWPEVIRPALSDRGGWAGFIGTPKGHNAFYELWQHALASEEWFALLLKASQTGLIPEAELADARRTMTEDQYAQEYECSFEAAIRGAYYAEEFRRADAEGRTSTPLVVERDALVHTAWDLGYTDATAIWFIQQVGTELRVVDYYEASGEALDHYVRVLRERGYLYGDHYMPHDVRHHELTSGRSRYQTLVALGITPTVVPQHKVEDGINATRLMFDRMWFDPVRCKAGIEALRQYRRDYDERHKIFRPRPLHDWTSHAADALRTFAAGFGGGVTLPAGRDYRRDSWRRSARRDPPSAWVA